MTNPFFKLGDLISKFFLLIPYPAGVKVIITIYFLGLAAMPFFFSKEYIYKGSEDKKPWKDLRIWALVTALLELAVYLYF